MVFLLRSTFTLRIPRMEEPETKNGFPAERHAGTHLGGVTCAGALLGFRQRTPVEYVCTDGLGPRFEDVRTGE